MLLALVAVTSAAAARAAEMEPLADAVCRLIETSARANRLPVAFLARVIWRESSFRAGAISPAGAQGIAQFMPATAASRGLADPFDPEQAIPKAARLIADLRRRFGNLGIAAAAYNAGAARVADWLRGQAGLPAETRAYVRFVTERGAEEWRSSGSAAPEAAADPAAGESCVAVIAELRRGGAAEEAEAAPLAPWGVQLAGNFSKAIALASFERAARRYAGVIGEARPMIIGRLLRSRGTRRFYQVRLPAGSRAAADALCRRIRGAGGACIAMHS
ncbi:MAG TPA: lytic transglycosylase domain-containing protein [Stellaceae bacterium]|nr:lytic transglycosylase domain-containing protein [Stellaceae bacterium]